MAFILSSSTSISFGSNSKTRGIISIQINSVPQVQRLPVLGSANPFSEIRKLQTQISLTRYGGGPTYITTPTEICNDANTISFSFSPGACGPIDSNLYLNGNFFVTSYSFSKEVNQFGQESWTIVDKPVTTFTSGGQVGTGNTVMPRGIADGQTTEGLNTGVTLDGSSEASGVSASLSAGNPGVGRANSLILGVVTSVGGSTTSKGSEDGSGQANIPYSPIDI